MWRSRLDEVVEAEEDVEFDYGNFALRSGARRRSSGRGYDDCDESMDYGFDYGQSDEYEDFDY